MRFVTRDTDYALRALIYMAKLKGRTATVDEIASKGKLPKVFLRRILQKLAGEKMLSSRKGKTGGFTFLLKPGDIKVTDIMRVFQGDIDLTNCLLKGKACPNKGVCSLRKKIKSINSTVIKELDKITIKSLAG
ncbi:MAG: Rrf2 family transcriptional regulator [Candidatus Omnitrophica bacterium]|nr:Rrf2 family transcriptional regulator [Candidatus Omnitrophota bacterium]